MPVCQDLTKNCFRILKRRKIIFGWAREFVGRRPISKLYVWVQGFRWILRCVVYFDQYLGAARTQKLVKLPF